MYEFKASSLEFLTKQRQERQKYEKSLPGPSHTSGAATLAGVGLVQHGQGQGRLVLSVDGTVGD